MKSNVPRPLDLYTDADVEVSKTRPKTFKQLSQVLNPPFLHDEKKIEKFETLRSMLYHGILYDDFNRMGKAFSSLLEDAYFFERSEIYPDYYLWMLFGAFTADQPVYVERFYQAVNTLSPFYMGQERFPVYSSIIGIYHYFNDEEKDAIAYLDRALEKLGDKHLRALVLHMKAKLLIDDYRNFHKTLAILNESIDTFESYANLIRSHKSKALKQIILVYLHRFEEFEALHASTIEYAKRSGLYDIYLFTRMNRARYYLINNDPQNALEVLEQFHYPASRYYILKLHAYYMLGRHEDLEGTYEIAHPLQRKLDIAFTKAIREACSTGSSSLKAFKDVVDRAFAKRDFLMISLSTRVYIKALESERCYKKAYEVARRYLGVLQNIQ